MAGMLCIFLGGAVANEFNNCFSCHLCEFTRLTLLEMIGIGIIWSEFFDLSPNDVA